MKRFIYISILLTSHFVWGQNVQLSFDSKIENDSIKIEILATGDGVTELGSSNFVFNVEGAAVDVTSGQFNAPNYSSASYSFWNYIHSNDFEHVMLSRTHQPDSLMKISNIKIGEITYAITDKCLPLELKWDTQKGDIRSYQESIKNNVSYIDTIIGLVDEVFVPNVIEGEESDKLLVSNSNNNLVKWYKDEEYLSEGSEVKTDLTGVYYATISNGCETKTTEQFRVDRLTSLERIDFIKETSIYPNPVIDELTLVMDDSKVTKVERVVLLNSVGQEIKELTNYTQKVQTTFNVTNWNLSEGIYFLKILYKGDTEILRFVY